MSEKPSDIIERMNRKLTVPISGLLVNISWITPNGITWMSALIGGVLGGWAIVAGLNLTAVILVLIGGLLDNLDGDLARARQCAT